MFRSFCQSRNPVMTIALDLAMVPFAWIGAYWLRFNLETIPLSDLKTALWVLPFVMLVQAVAFRYYGLYRGVWSFASIADAVRITKSVVVGVAFTAMVIFLVNRMEGLPRSVFPIYTLLLIGLLGSMRFAARWLTDKQVSQGEAQRVLIVGAGRAGEMLVRDLLRNPKGAFHPVGFVDDQSTKMGREIHGVRVLGPCSEIADFTERLEIDLIVLAIPSAGPKVMRRLVDLCERTSKPFRTLPPIERLMAGDVVFDQLREVSIDDLLGRDQVSLDWELIRNGIKGKSILVSGGGGSIGSELCRQIARLQPSQLVIIDNSEFNLYSVEQELHASFPEARLKVCLVDVTDVVAVGHLFNEVQPAYVFHAAAYKHVPMLESQVREAVYNNILGTKIIASASDRFGCEAFVMISTDKAVNPANVMGTTKRAAEIYCQNLNLRSHTRFLTVRFGNVLGSAGSVVPLFRKQIQNGGPVTVTHREITRYFMTIPEACQLILQTSTMGAGGEIFVLDMGEPIKISYLAEQMIRLSGKVPDVDIDIVYTGLRPGEKLYEELFHESEALQSTTHEKVLLSKHRTVNWEWLGQTMDKLKAACEDYDEAELKDLLKELVPEWEDPEMEAGSSDLVVISKDNNDIGRSDQPTLH